MSDRTVVVRLQANVDQYQRAVGNASRQTRVLEQNVGRAHHSMRGLQIASGLAGAGVGAAGAALVISSVRMAASFDKTMRLVQVGSGASAQSLKSLSDYALEMGAKTTFSAQQAADAMLELANSGFTEAQIKGGALASTLTLAAAGQIDLADAAGYVTTGLAQFSLGVTHASDVASALAGAANATKADVGDFGLALSQVGPGAAQAGLSLQQTLGVLALFAKNGIQGSDAGTSLKTMLQRLVPQTTAAKDAMGSLHLKFTDAHGTFLSVDKIAQQLHDHLGKLSDAQRTTALNTIFGSDASRAAAILMKEGAGGVQAMTRATSDKTAADVRAKAATQGTAGALEQMNGSIETAKIKLGTALAPLIVDMAGEVGHLADRFGKDAVPAIERFVTGMEKGTGPGGQFVDVLGALKDAGGEAWHVVHPMFSFIADHPDLFKEVAKDAALLALAMKGVGTIRRLPGVGSIVGGSGGPLGGSFGRPVPVYVTNAGGLGGGGVGIPGGVGAAAKLGVAGTLNLVGLSIAAKLAADQAMDYVIANGNDRGGLLGQFEGLAGKAEKFGTDISLAGASVRVFKSIFDRNTGGPPKRPKHDPTAMDSIQAAAAEKRLADMGIAAGRAGNRIALGLGPASDSVDRLTQRFPHLVIQGRATTDSLHALERQIADLPAPVATAGDSLRVLERRMKDLPPLINLDVGVQTHQESLRALEQKLHNLPRDITIEINLATHQSSLRSIERDLGIPTGPVSSGTITPAPGPTVSNPATRDAGLHIHGDMVVQQLPGQSLTGTVVQSLEQAAFLAGS